MLVAVNVRAVTHITYHITLSDLTMTHNIPPHLELIRKKEHITHIPLTDLIMTHIIPTHLDLSNSMEKIMLVAVNVRAFTHITYHPYSII